MKQFKLTKEDLLSGQIVYGEHNARRDLLLSETYQTLTLGSGCLFIDDDINAFEKIVSYTKKLNRENDLIVLNYSNEKLKFVSELKIKQSTLNPFLIGSKKDIASLVRNLLMSYNGKAPEPEDIWNHRSMSFFKALLSILYFLKEKDCIQLTFKTIMKSFPIETAYQLAYFNDNDPNIPFLKFINELPENCTAPLKSFFDNALPAFLKLNADLNNIDPKCIQEYSFLIMQLIHMFNELSKKHDYVFNSEKNEIDFNDIVFNKKIFLVILPNKNNDKEKFDALSEMVLSCFKTHFSSSISEDKIIKSKSMTYLSNKKEISSPFLIVMNNINQYLPNGFSELLLSLNIAPIYAYEKEHPSVKSTSELHIIKINTEITINLNVIENINAKIPSEKRKLNKYPISVNTKIKNYLCKEIIFNELYVSPIKKIVNFLKTSLKIL